jgi:hypothetical protein
VVAVTSNQRRYRLTYLIDFRQKEKRLMSALPETLQSPIDELLRSVRRHPQHECGWVGRRQLYDALDDARALAWLELIAARKVVDIYERGLPPEFAAVYRMTPEEIEEERADREAHLDDLDAKQHEIEMLVFNEEMVPVEALPRRMCEVAEGVLRGTFPKAVAAKVSGNFYHTFPDNFEYALDDCGVEISFATECAYHAAHRAVLAACDFHPLGRVGRIVSFGTVNITQGEDGEGQIDANQQPPQNSRNMSDLELARASAADAAAYAMVAYAVKPDITYQEAMEGDPLDVDRVLAYWEWWLGEAVGTAWKAAH